MLFSKRKARGRRRKADEAAAKKKAQRRPAAAAAAEADGQEVLRHIERLKLTDFFGLNEVVSQGSPTTTVQAPGLRVAVAGAPTSQNGLIVGLDAWTLWPVIIDVFALYKDPTSNLSSPNVVVIGDVGTGKSTMMKTWGVMRPLALGRRVVVIDKKLQASKHGGREGEYVALARELGYQPIQLRIGKGAGGTRLNILDPAISGGGAGEATGQQLLLEAVATEAANRDLTSRERKALRVARRTAIAHAREAGRVADVRDVVNALFEPDAEVVRAERGVASVEELREWGLEVAFDLEVLIDEELAGLIDGPTSEGLDLQSGLMVFDISSLPEEGPAIPIAMALIDTWLRSVIASREDTVPTVFAIEEGWHIVDGRFAKVAHRNQKVARGVALQNMTALQHISDIDPSSPAISTIKEAGVTFVFGQSKYEDAEACAKTLNWPKATIDLIQTLPQGTCLLQVADEPPVLVSCMRSPSEVELTNTDTAMESRSTVSVQQTVRDATSPGVDQSQGRQKLAAMAEMEQ